MGFYLDIATTYGTRAEKDLKSWAKTLKQLASLRNQRIFLLKCRRLNIFPRHIDSAADGTTQHLYIPDGTVGGRIHHFNNRLKHKLINLEIRSIFRVLNEKERFLRALEISLHDLIPHHIRSEFFNRQNIVYNRKFNTIKQNNIRKIDNLRSTQEIKIKTKANWIKNLTDIQIPTDVSEFISLGPKFSIPTTTRHFPIIHTLAEIEKITRDLDTKEKNVIIARTTNVITNYLHSPGNHNNSLNNLYNKSKRFLSQNPDLLVLRADKGAVTVLISKEHYHNLALDILNDDEAYLTLNRDPTSTIQQKANKLMSNLKKDGQVDELTAKNHMIYNSVAPKFYGLPKIHKEPIKLRPIISSIDSPSSKVSTLVANILSKAYDQNNPYFTKDSFQFAQEFNDREIPENHVLVSLDVTSLFSNITLDLTVNCLKKKWNTIQPHCNIEINRFIELVSFIFNNTFFAYNGNFYKQTLGAPMGGQASSIIALYVMDELLDTCIPKLPFQLPAVKKYVDDLFCIIPAGKDEEILTTFNNYDRHIQFTIEKEDENNSVPFLDTRVIRTSNNLIKLNWYTKPTSSGRYLNFHSDVSTKMKINLVTAMKNRIHKICHPDFYNANIMKLFNIFLDNSYPRSLLNRILHYPVDRTVAIPPAPNEEPPTNDKYGTLPNINNLTPKLISILKETNTKIATKNIFNINNLFSKTKDTTGIMEKSNVVYKISCQDCTSTYIGQTSRNLKGRIISHKSDCRTNKNTCALAQHVIATNHRPAYNQVKILDSDTSYTRRTFKEMVRIHQEDNSLNKKSDIDNLSQIYSLLISIDKRGLNNSNEEDSISNQSP